MELVRLPFILLPADDLRPEDSLTDAILEEFGIFSYHNEDLHQNRMGRAVRNGFVNIENGSWRTGLETTR